MIVGTPKFENQLSQCMHSQIRGRIMSYYNNKPHCIRCDKQHDSVSCTKNRKKCTF